MSEQAPSEDRELLRSHVASWRIAAARLEEERAANLRALRESRSIDLLDGWMSVLAEASDRRALDERHGFARWHARLAGLGMR